MSDAAPDDTGAIQAPPTAGASGSGRRRFQANSPRVGDQRREAILDSLEALLAATPVAELTMDSIASAASLSRTSVYFYFKSKTEAVEALISRASEEMRAQMYARTAKESLPEFVARIVSAARDGWQRHRAVFVAAVDLSSHANELTIRWHQTMRAFVVTLAEAVRCENTKPPRSITDTEAEQRAEIVCWMVERNFYFLFAREHSDEEVERLATELTRAALAVLSA